MGDTYSNRHDMGTYDTALIELLRPTEHGTEHRRYPFGFDWATSLCAFDDMHDEPFEFASERTAWNIIDTDVVFCNSCKTHILNAIETFLSAEESEYTTAEAKAADSLVRAIYRHEPEPFGSTGTWVDTHEAVQAISAILTGPNQKARRAYVMAIQMSNLSVILKDPNDQMAVTFSPFNASSSQHMYVEPRTLDLIVESAGDVPRPDLISDLDLPDFGFVLFGKPLPDVLENEGTRCGHVAGLSWARAGMTSEDDSMEGSGVLAVTLWSTPGLVAPTVGKGVPTNSTVDRLVTQFAVEDSASQPANLYPLTPSVMLDKGHPLLPKISTPETLAKLEDWNHTHNYWVRFLVAFGAWIQSTITPEDMDNPRHIRRQYTRKKQTAPTIRMVKLRGIEKLDEHREPAEPGNRNSKFDHRWVVSGHWRQQACGPNHSRRRPLYIAPYVKGPEDGELRHTQRIFKVDR